MTNFVRGWSTHLNAQQTRFGPRQFPKATQRRLKELPRNSFSRFERAIPTQLTANSQDGVVQCVERRVLFESLIALVVEELLVEFSLQQEGKEWVDMIKVATNVFRPLFREQFHWV